MNFGKALRVCRAARRFTQQQTARRAGLSSAYVSLIESSKREPSLGTLRKLANALDIPVDLFFLLAVERPDTTKADVEDVNTLARSLLALVAHAG